MTSANPHPVSAESWEYMVIHLNVEPPSPSQPANPPRAAEGGGGEEAAQARPVFSDGFLKKEFPQFYESRPAPERGAAPQHPAQQLQQFLNGHGAQGWELIGVFPVGSLSMLFFRRRRGSNPAPPPSPAATPASATPAAREPMPLSGQAAARSEEVLDDILARLALLEQQRAPQAAARTRATRPPAPRRRPSPRQEAPSPADGERLDADQLQRLAGETPLPGSAAALAIGLRSAASLANHGARHGYQPGLCKLGPNGRIAVYAGLGEAERGGKPRRLWIVVPRERLQG